MPEDFPRPILSEPFRLTSEQVWTLQPYFDRRGGSYFIVGSVFADGGGWSLQLTCLPDERRLSVREACAGRLKLSKPKEAALRKPPPLVPFPSPQPPAA